MMLGSPTSQSSSDESNEDEQQGFGSKRKMPTGFDLEARLTKKPCPHSDPTWLFINSSYASPPLSPIIDLQVPEEPISCPTFSLLASSDDSVNASPIMTSMVGRQVPEEPICCSTFSLPATSDYPDNDVPALLPTSPLDLPLLPSAPHAATAPGTPIPCLPPHVPQADDLHSPEADFSSFFPDHGKGQLFHGAPVSRQCQTHQCTSHFCEKQTKNCGPVMQASCCLQCSSKCNLLLANRLHPFPSSQSNGSMLARSLVFNSEQFDNLTPEEMVSHRWACSLINAATLETELQLAEPHFAENTGKRV